MMIRMKPSALSLPLLLLFVVLCCIPLHAAARAHIVVDLEGTVEDYASLATITQSPSLRTQLSLVTVSGLTWGHASTVARNVCRFLSLAKLEGVTISIGTMQATADTYDDAISRGGCTRSQGFPATPLDAARRGMRYSRVDVTNSFGAAYALPVKSCQVLANASRAFYSLTKSISVSDTMTYLALSGVSNLVAGLKYLERHDPQQLQQLRRVMKVHLLEKGYSLAVDAAATVLVIEEPCPGLNCSTYLPSFYDPALSFTSSKWVQFERLANGVGVSKTVAWLYSAWKAKKELIDSRDGDPSKAFFDESSLASVLVTLCALDATVQQSCNEYCIAASRVSLRFDGHTSHVEGAGSYRISGRNVTSEFFVLVEAWNASSSSKATQFVLSHSADESPSLSTATRQGQLVHIFWSVWFDILHM